MIGAVYVYLFSRSQAFAMASAFSTVLFGLLGGGFYPYFQRGKWKYKDLFLLACFAEVCDMVSLLRFTVPVQMALKTILEISGPMILLNAGGILIFISSFNNIFIRQDLESSRQRSGRQICRNGVCPCWWRDCTKGKIWRNWLLSCWKGRTGQG